MNHRALTALFALAAVALLAPLPLAAQAGDEMTKTADGQPDISGIYTFRGRDLGWKNQRLRVTISGSRAIMSEPAGIRLEGPA